MKIEAGNAVYKELESKVYLSPWSKLTRDTLTMNGGAAVVTLADQRLQLVEAQNAKGVDDQPGRRLEFSADQLDMNFDDDGQVNHIAGQRNAHLTSTAPIGRDPRELGSRGSCVRPPRIGPAFCRPPRRWDTRWWNRLRRRPRMDNRRNAACCAATC